MDGARSLRAGFVPPKNGAGCIVVGEVAQAHDGSLGTAHAYIDAIAAAGADAVKFQTHIAAAESTPGEPWRVKFSRQDESRYAYWKRMEFTPEQWMGLADHARERGLWFLSSPFSAEAVDLLERVGVAAWKIASGETGNRELLARIARTSGVVLLSTGMSGLKEVDAAVALFRAARRPIAVMQCTSAYPCPAEKIGLNVLPLLQDRYDAPVGLSDHSGTIFPSLAAATLGAAIVEVHVTFSREAFGPDVPASVTTGELKTLVEGTAFISRMREHPVDKDRLAGEMEPLRKLFTKSVVARVDLPAGTVLRAEHLAAKKPGTGIPASRLPEIVGTHLLRPVKADEVLRECDVEPGKSVERYS